MALIIFGLSLLLFLKSKLPKDEQPQPQPFGGNNVDAATAVYMTGPLRAIFDALTKSEAMLVSVHNSVTDIQQRQRVNRLEIKDDFAGLLSDQRRQLSDQLERIGPNVGNQLSQAEARLSDNVNGVHERIDDVAKELVTLTGKVDQLPKRRQ